MLVLLGLWRLRPGCLERLGDDLWMRVTLRVQRLCRYVRMSREAWGRSMDASDLAHAEVMSLRTQVVAQQAEAEAVHRGTEAAEEASDSDDRVRETKMAPKRRTTRLNPETTLAATAATTTTFTNAQLQAMIDQGVTAVLATRDANTNGVDSHNSGTCAS
ncbi:hypothetical protein Tco_1498321, partial [Tanacetum coccineum]